MTSTSARWWMPLQAEALNSAGCCFFCGFVVFCEGVATVLMQGFVIIGTVKCLTVAPVSHKEEQKKKTFFTIPASEEGRSLHTDTTQ